MFMVFFLIGKMLCDGVVKYWVVGVDIYFVYMVVVVFFDGVGYLVFVVYLNLFWFEFFLQQYFYGKGNYYWWFNDDGLYGVDIVKCYVGKLIGYLINLVMVISFVFIQCEYQIMFVVLCCYFFFVQYVIVIFIVENYIQLINFLGIFNEIVY